jgi:hypothetical protein
MANIPGVTYVDITRPSTGTTEHVPTTFTYVSTYGPWIKPGVPWPSADAPVQCVDSDGDNTGIAPTSWTSAGTYGRVLASPNKFPSAMPAGEAEPAELVPAPEPEPEPAPGEEPAPEPAPTFGVRVAKFLGRGDDARLVALADEHAPVIEQFVNAYVRGNGVTVDAETLALTFPQDLQSVILTSTARLVVNPAQLERETYDGYTATGSFRGFNLPELFVLNRYRRRSA